MRKVTVKARKGERSEEKEIGNRGWIRRGRKWCWEKEDKRRSDGNERRRRVDLLVPLNCPIYVLLAPDSMQGNCRATDARGFKVKSYCLSAARQPVCNSDKMIFSVLFIEKKITNIIGELKLHVTHTVNWILPVHTSGLDNRKQSEGQCYKIIFGSLNKTGERGKINIFGYPHFHV